MTFKTGMWIGLAIAVYWQFDVLLALMTEILHVSFELFEFMLDLLIERVFDTDRHTSQMIAFYLMLLLAVLVLYKAVRRLADWYFKFKNYLAILCSPIHRDLPGYWRKASAMTNIKWWAVMTLGAGLALMGLFV
ncbi:MAG: hypothetical protein ACU83N_04300 [Gammaproteobacteria bacterium]